MRRLALHRSVLAAALCAVAAGSLALKVAVGPLDREQMVGRDLDQATTAATALLEGDGFAISDPGTRDSPIMRASNGACELTIVFGDPRGFHQGTADRLTSAAGWQRTFYKGRAYDRLPVARSWLSYYRWATLAEVGYADSYPLVEHVVMRPGCDARSPLFTGLRRITGPIA